MILNLANDAPDHCFSDFVLTAVVNNLDLTSHLTSHTMAFQEWFMTKWQLQEAKARFSELIDDTLEKGPQVVTRRGIDTAVVVSIDEWHKLKEENRLTWKDVLLGEGPRFEIPLPKRGMVKSRRPVVFD
jgi:prevent-host-death family protein